MDRVLCAIIRNYATKVDEQDVWMDKVDLNSVAVMPLINHPHSDKENGQQEIHYHVDSRYLGNQPHLRKYTTILATDVRVTKDRYELIYLSLNKNNDYYGIKTPVEGIKNSKLKHKCIYKGKCPHRGFPLDNVKPENGVITCPLHSLRFDAKTKQII